MRPWFDGSNHPVAEEYRTTAKQCLSDDFQVQLIKDSVRKKISRYICDKDKIGVVRMLFAYIFKIKYSNE